MSAILEAIRRRAISKSGYAIAREKELAISDPRGGLEGTIDNDVCYARFVVSTRDVDASGDIMEPRGCLNHLDRFRNNPVWFYDHFDPKGQRVKYPIGKADGPAGTKGVLDFHTDENKVTVGCWFQQDTPEGRDVYNLVKGCFLRSTSIAFIPHRAEKLKNADGYHYIEWEPTEISVTGVPDNPFVRTLEVKSLESQALKRSWSFGTETEETMQYATIQFTKKLWTKEKALTWLKSQKHDGSLMTETKTHWVFSQGGVPGEPTQLGKGIVAMKAKEDETLDEEEGDETEKKPEEDAETPEEKDEEPKGEVGDIPPGATVLRDCMKHHMGVHQYHKDMMPFIKHPAVKNHMEEEMKHAEARVDAAKETAGEAYPEMDFEKFCRKDEADNPDEEPESGKKPVEPSADVEKDDEEDAEEIKNLAKKLKAAS